MTTVHGGNSSLQREIAALRNDRKTGVSQFKFRDLAEVNRFPNVVKDRQKAIKNQRKGTPLARLTGQTSVTSSGLLEQFRTQHTTPRHNDDLGDEDETNVVLAVNRQVKPINESYGSIGPGQLGILYKNNENNLNTERFAGTAITVQCNPMDVIPPEVYNHAIRVQQEREASLFPELYRQRTPADYWRDYSIDGVIEHQGPMMNRASVFTCGTTIIDNSLASASSCNKLATVGAAGPVSIYNYWGKSVRPGAKLYALIKKFHPSDYGMDYSVQKNITVATLQSQAKAIPELRPYQMCFLCLPYGGPVPPEHTRYFDEDGRIRTDTEVIYIGMVTEVPANFVPTPDQSPLKPFVALPQCPIAYYGPTSDTTVLYNSSAPQRLMKIILDSDDGLM